MEEREFARLPLNVWRGQELTAAGSVLGAILASSCCIVPLILFLLGVSGAWIGALTSLAPYQPYFIAATVAFLGIGYWLVYQSSKRACADNAACARPLPKRLVLIGLIAATLLVVTALLFDFFTPQLINS